jgi:hypothetical protein
MRSAFAAYKTQFEIYSTQQDYQHMGKPPRNNLSGQTFGRLTVTKKWRRNEKRRVEWLCRCRCGNKKWVQAQCLIGEYANSCGCLRDEMNRAKMSGDNPGRPCASKTHKKNCKFCGNEFLGLATKEFCSAAHKSRYQSTAKAIARASKLKCLQCGNPIPLLSGRWITCSRRCEAARCAESAYESQYGSFEEQLFAIRLALSTKETQP